MQYRYLCSSLEGFVQQIAVGYVSKGYRFYVSGKIPDGKDPTKTDEKILARYGIAVSKWARARRKLTGQASLQYLRFERLFVILATHGNHPFFAMESDIKDFARTPLVVDGYSISFRGGHAHVRIAEKTYLELKAHFLDRAVHRSVDSLVFDFYSFPFEPYAPIRRQAFNIWRGVNRRRKVASFKPVPKDAVWLKRRVVKPFDGANQAV